MISLIQNNGKVFLFFFFSFEDFQIAINPKRKSYKAHYTYVFYLEEP